MRIVIAGAGEVGTYLAKLLSNENMNNTFDSEKTAQADRFITRRSYLPRISNFHKYTP
jgi:Trk K+ transport system NAD-binding subunit